MRGLRRGSRTPDYLADALTLLAGWTHDERDLTRVLDIDEAQHAALTERIKVVADALQLSPRVRRLDGRTQITVCGAEDPALSAGVVALAARIEDAYRTVTGLPA